MPPRLILNADDFGLTPGINRAIAELHQAGALTSATLMANGLAFDDAVAIAPANPTLGVGCPITLAVAIPIPHPQRIPPLISGTRQTLRPPAGSSPPTTPSPSPPPAPSQPTPPPSPPTPSLPKASSTCAAIPATTTRTSTPSPPVCAPRATSSAQPSSPPSRK